MDRMPLEGIRIVDFCWVWAGPTCTTLLAMLGAEVIKIETWNLLHPSRRAVMRQGAEPPPPNESMSFNVLNPNKLDITLNLRQPRSNARAKFRPNLRVNMLSTHHPTKPHEVVHPGANMKLTAAPEHPAKAHRSSVSTAAVVPCSAT